MLHCRVCVTALGPGPHCATLQGVFVRALGLGPTMLHYGVCSRLRARSPLCYTEGLCVLEPTHRLVPK